MKLNILLYYSFKGGVLGISKKKRQELQLKEQQEAN
jgi:hypothetical protein